jgi:deoxyribonuclease V
MRVELGCKNMEVVQLHRWNITPQEAKDIQRELSRFVTLVPCPKKISYVAGADVAYKSGTNMGWAAIAVFSFPSLELVEARCIKSRVTFPYIPTLLSFREGPIILDALSKIKSEPDLIIFNGHGIAHPLRMGLATHMGIILKRPTIGCAKKPLVGMYDEPKGEAGAHSSLVYEGEVVGAALKTKKNSLIFVSPGFLVTLEESIKLVLSCTKDTKFPIPLLFAHLLASERRSL